VGLCGQQCGPPNGEELGCQPGAGGEQVTSTPYVRVAWAVLFMSVGLLALGLVLLPEDRWLTLQSGSQLVGNGLLGLACSAVGS
jgi:hypothetical protein